MDKRLKSFYVEKALRKVGFDNVDIKDIKVLSYHNKLFQSYMTENVPIKFTYKGKKYMLCLTKSALFNMIMAKKNHYHISFQLMYNLNDEFILKNFGVLISNNEPISMDENAFIYQTKLPYIFLQDIW